MYEKQKFKLNDIQNSFVNKKKEKLEELNKLLSKSFKTLSNNDDHISLSKKLNEDTRHLT